MRARGTGPLIPKLGGARGADSNLIGIDLSENRPLAWVG